MKNISLRKAATAALLLACTLGSHAQNNAPSIEGASYYLPKTALWIALQIEKTTYSPGEFAPYASRFLKRNDVEMDASETYRIAGLKLTTAAQPDTAKFFTAKADAKHSIRTIERDDAKPQIRRLWNVGKPCLASENKDTKIMRFRVRFP